MSSPATDSVFINTFISAFVKNGLNRAGPMMTPQFTAFLFAFVGGSMTAFNMPPLPAVANIIKMIPNAPRPMIEAVADDISLAVKKTVDLRLTSDVDFFMDIIAGLTSFAFTELKRSMNLTIGGMHPMILKDVRAKIQELNAFTLKPIIMGVYDVAIAAVNEARGPAVGPAAPVSISGPATSPPRFSAKIGGYKTKKAKRSKKARKTRGRR
jgi:hypothetical protein